MTGVGTGGSARQNRGWTRRHRVGVAIFLVLLSLNVLLAAFFPFDQPYGQSWHQIPAGYQFHLSFASCSPCRGNSTVLAWWYWENYYTVGGCEDAFGLTLPASWCTYSISGTIRVNADATVCVMGSTTASTFCASSDSSNCSTYPCDFAFRLGYSATRGTNDLVAGSYLLGLSTEYPDLGAVALTNI
jgi:hypothetical protein